jgi:hypothetical protein
MSKSKMLVAICGALLLGSGAFAQNKLPVETRNAALRYWLAFADLQDPPSDPATAELLEKTAAGEAAWDEAKLGPILDKNEEAIRRMQRATRLPECDWGLEYDLGPRASIAYVPRARVLARLNTLYGMRLAAKGNTQEAVDTWLAGIRFSQHLAKGGTLIFSLIARMGLLSNFHALEQATQSGELSQAERTEAAEAVRALPETGFDWSTALAYEGDPLDIAVKEMKQAQNPAEYFQELTRKPAPENFTSPTATDTTAFHRVMNEAALVLALPPQQAEQRLKRLQDAVNTLHPLYREVTPSFLRINQARAAIAAARQKLLQRLESRS